MDYLETVWNHMVKLQSELDALVKQVPGVLLAVSAITATKTTKRKGQEVDTIGHTKPQYNVYPGVGYWIVSDESEADDRNLFNIMQNNPVGATLKLLIQPYQQTQDTISNILFSVVKDNNHGYVRRKLGNALGTQTTGLPNVKLISLSKRTEELCQNVHQRLAEARFPIELENSAS